MANGVQHWAVIGASTSFFYK